MVTRKTSKAADVKAASVAPKKAATPFDVAAPSKASAKVKKPLFGLAKGYGYPGMGKGGDHEITRSTTLAILKVSGHINISPKTGLVTKPRTAGDLSLFTALSAGKLARVWKPLLQSGEYLAKAQSAIKGEAANGYNAQAELVEKIVGLIHKGGKATFKGKNGPVEVAFTNKLNS